MAKKQTRSRAEQTRPSADRLTHPLLEKLGPIPAAQAELFAYSVKVVCGKQTETNCCCVAGARPGVYATEVKHSKSKSRARDGVEDRRTPDQLWRRCRA
jgi:hypothetical protein